MNENLKESYLSVNRKIIFIYLAYFIYVISTLFLDKLLTALSFISIYIITIVILEKSIKEIESYRVCWKLLLCASIINFILDLALILDCLVEGYDKHSALFTTINVLPNIFIMLAGIYYLKKNIDKFKSVHLIIDIVTVIIMVLTFGITFLAELKIDVVINFKSLIEIMYIITDVISFAVVLIIKLSIDKIEEWNTCEIISFGILIYILINLFFIFDSNRDREVVDNLFIKAISFLPYIIFSIGAIYEGMCERNNIRIKKQKNYLEIKDYKTNDWVIILPLISLFFIEKFELCSLLAFIIVIFVRVFFSYYVKSSFYAKYLLQEEKRIKVRLEHMVDERTLELSEANKRLKNIADKDYLTNTYNRRFFNTELDRLLKKHKEGNVTLFYIDLVRFKFINDCFGHDSGDSILITTAKRLKEATPKKGILCRLGGDEFAIILEGEKTEKELRLYATNLIDTIGKEIILDNYRFEVNVSVGIAVSRKGDTRKSLLKCADFAMYKCKEHLGSYYEIYSEKLNNQLERKNNIEKLLRNVDFESEFEVHYQPQFDIKTKIVKGVEALIRWDSEELGYIPPSEFIPIAEECGIIKDIGNWVLLRALKEIRKLNIKYKTKIRISVNVSAAQINNFDFIKNLMEVVENNGIDTTLVNLELTEGIKIEGNKLVKDNLKKISDLGFSISIDDFGSGYASFSYIEKFNVNEIKIDKSLVDNISSKNSDLKIIKAIIMMAKGLNIETIAEGIETYDQLEKLRELGCDEVQGYIWSKPLSKSEFEEKYLKANYCIKRK